jgi:hypothetical protein
VEAEKGFPRPHLISQNIANGRARIEKPHAAVSVFNFHYATPPDTVAMNYRLNKVIGDNETGFRGTTDRPYRTEGWDFLLAGGGLYNNLDYSFTVGHEDGTFVFPSTQPGGGSPALRKQLRILKDFLYGFDFVRMKPDNAVIKGGAITSPLAVGAAPEAKVTARALAEAGKAYALYVNGGTQAELMLELPAGPYRAEWLNPKTGKIDKREEFEHAGGQRKLVSPAYVEDIALRVLRAEKNK